jgi:hypothetical protein
MTRMAITEMPSTKNRSLLPAWGHVRSSQDIALQRLISAIIIQAAADARKRYHAGREARDWLLSKECADLCDLIGLDFIAVLGWVDNGCPDWRK